MLGLVLHLAAVQANMMTMRREVDGQRRLARVGMLVMKIKTQNMMWMMRLMSIMTKADVVQMGEAENRAQSRT